MQPRWLPLLEACDPESITNLWLIDSPAPQGDLGGGELQTERPHKFNTRLVHQERADSAAGVMQKGKGQDEVARPEGVHFACLSLQVLGRARSHWGHVELACGQMSPFPTGPAGCWLGSLRPLVLVYFFWQGFSIRFVLDGLQPGA